MTLAAIAALVFAAGSRLLMPGDSEGLDATPPLPAVAAPPAPPRPAARPPPQVLERLPVSRAALELPAARASGVGAPEAGSRLYEILPLDAAQTQIAGPLRVEYTLDAELTRQVFEVLERGRVGLGHVILLNPATGSVLAYASTDVARFPPTRAYPAASLIKVITAAAALDSDPQTARLPCRSRGSPYRLTPSRIDPPKNGRVVSLRRALATSNNQCFAQLAVHAVGGEALVDAISRFGWLSPPAPGHDPGRRSSKRNILLYFTARVQTVGRDAEIGNPRWCFGTR